MRKLWNIEIPVVLTDANRGIIVSRMYLISAYFDDKTNRILQGYMKRIAAKTGKDTIRVGRAIASVCYVCDTGVK